MLSLNGPWGRGNIEMSKGFPLIQVFEAIVWVKFLLDN